MSYTTAGHEVGKRRSFNEHSASAGLSAIEHLSRPLSFILMELQTGRFVLMTVCAGRHWDRKKTDDRKGR